MTDGPGEARAPIHVVVMGVSGSGKSTVGHAVAEALGAEFIEGDDHHPPANLAKMAAGQPLTDADRGPWLDLLAATVAAADADGRSTVTACSALRRAYRDRMRMAVPPGRMRFVALEVDEATLQERMERPDHFMPSSLLASQRATLEPLAPDEGGRVIDGRAPLARVVADVVAAARARCP